MANKVGMLGEGKVVKNREWRDWRHLEWEGIEVWDKFSKSKSIIINLAVSIGMTDSEIRDFNAWHCSQRLGAFKIESE
jgi:hypothetical protein